MTEVKVPWGFNRFGPDSRWINAGASNLKRGDLELGRWLHDALRIKENDLDWCLFSLGQGNW